LKNFFDKKNIESVRAVNAFEGLKKFKADSFHTVITDITMESRLSGLFLARKIFKTNYSGNIIIATTGFDFPFVMKFSKFFLPIFAGVHFMIPKVPLKKGDVIFYPTTLKKDLGF
jgi:hypothetical protein